MDNAAEVMKGLDKQFAEPDALLADLATMSPIEYGLKRKEMAGKVGCSVRFLDEEREVRRRKAASPGDGETGSSFLASPDLWAEAVNGAELLDNLVRTAKAHLILPNGAAEAIALWVILAHAHDSFNISPVLAVTSPTPECGKTTLLTYLNETVPRPLPASNVTASTVFRAVEKWTPTLLIDEADTFLRDKDELRGVLNSGHNRGSAYVLRCVGDDFEPKQFCTWAPKAVALIGKLPPTLASRSIHIRLRRKAASEAVTPLRQDRADHLAPLCQKAARFAADNAIMLHVAEPDMPASLYGRSADNWRPLLAIADAAGGKWPERARKVAEEFAGRGNEEVVQIMLLQDIRGIWEKRKADSLHSQDIVADLVSMEGRPWPEWKSDKPMTKNQLAKLLEPFGITSRQVWVNGKNLNGYERDAFTETFKFYLSGDGGAGNSRTLDALETKDFSENETLGPGGGLEFGNARNPNELNGSRVLEFEEPLDGGDNDPFATMRSPAYGLQPKKGD